MATMDDVTPEVLKLLDAVAHRRNAEGNLIAGSITIRDIRPTPSGNGVELRYGSSTQPTPNLRIFNPPVEKYEQEGKDPALIIEDVVSQTGVRQ